MPTSPTTEKTMLQLMLDHCSQLTTGKVIFFGVVLAVALEALTVWMRFGLGLQSTRDTGLIGLFTFGLRIHHGYLGILLGVFAAWWFKERDPLGNICWMIAIALFMSDAFHHFLVLWPVTGSPQFHLVYPRR
jgi:hypothetical protein